ncbi:MAG TPA: phosphotransferase [Phototrophicaceae bacterium]|nr:phosphotransferase [Phototrophicaceae bacterium]
MQPFETLNYNDQLERLTEAARVALRSYGYHEADLHSVAYTNNAVFEALTPDGGHFAVRLHRPGHKRVEWIKSELVWLAAICRDTTLCVPRPIQPIDGEPIVYVPVAGLSEPIVGTVFAWIDGRFEGANTLSLNQVRAIGAFLSRLHDYSMRFEPPASFSRPRLDEHGLSGGESAYSSGAGSALFTDEDRRVFQQVEERVRNVMRALTISQATFGLIHADFLMKNMVFKDDEICAIDFDDCSWGYFLYDLAPLMLQFKDEPRYPELRDALWEGYSAQRALPETYRAYVETFVAARDMFSCWWVAGNLHNPRVRERAPELIAYRVAELRRFLETGSIAQQGEIF